MADLERRGARKVEIFGPRNEIKKPVPFAQQVTGYYHCLQEFGDETKRENFDKQVKRYGVSYTAWEIWRKLQDPFHKKGVGIERRFIHLGSGAAVREQILEWGDSVYTDLRRSSSRFTSSRINKVVLEGEYDPDILLYLHPKFGSVLGYLKSYARSQQSPELFDASEKWASDAKRFAGQIPFILTEEKVKTDNGEFPVLYHSMNLPKAVQDSNLEDLDAWAMTLKDEQLVHFRTFETMVKLGEPSNRAMFDDLLNNRSYAATNWAQYADY